MKPHLKPAIPPFATDQKDDATFDVALTQGQEAGARGLVFPTGSESLFPYLGGRSPAKCLEKASEGIGMAVEQLAAAP